MWLPKLPSEAPEKRRVAMGDLQGHMLIQWTSFVPGTKPFHADFSLKRERKPGRQAVSINISDWHRQEGDSSFFFKGTAWDLAAAKVVTADGRYDPNAIDYQGFVDFS